MSTKTRSERARSSARKDESLLEPKAWLEVSGKLPLVLGKVLPFLVLSLAGDTMLRTRSRCLSCPLVRAVGECHTFGCYCTLYQRTVRAIAQAKAALSVGFAANTVVSIGMQIPVSFGSTSHCEFD
uniref:Uncharacterized protein n=1 Tax=Phytophthora infestans TaxID=4787 RepID=Q572F5_PHYIN|nr:hypothetical protein PI49.0290 [Phytophthora infestans]